MSNIIDNLFLLDINNHWYYSHIEINLITSAIFQTVVPSFQSQNFCKLVEIILYH